MDTSFHTLQSIRSRFRQELHESMGSLVRDQKDHRQQGPVGQGAPQLDRHPRQRQFARRCSTACQQQQALPTACITGVTVKRSKAKRKALMLQIALECKTYVSPEGHQQKGRFSCCRAGCLGSPTSKPKNFQAYQSVQETCVGLYHFCHRSQGSPAPLPEPMKTQILLVSKPADLQNNPGAQW